MSFERVGYVAPPVGSDRFIATLEVAIGRRLPLGMRGRPRKVAEQ